jgi:hypothetical protein
VVVLLPLAPHRENGHAPRLLDFEQRRIAGIPERNDQFAQEWTTGTSDGLAALERKDFQPFNRFGERGLGALGCGYVLLKKEVEQSQEVLLRLRWLDAVPVERAPREWRQSSRQFLLHYISSAITGEMRRNGKTDRTIAAELSNPQRRGHDWWTVTGISIASRLPSAAAALLLVVAIVRTMTPPRASLQQPIAARYFLPI